MVILISLTILSLITGNDLFSYTNSYDTTISQTLNGTVSDLDVNLSGSFNLSSLQDAILWISVCGGIAVGAGVTILASGLNETASHWLVYMIFFIAIWTVFSGLSFPLISSIPVFGSIFYIGLTIIYGISSILWIGGKD